MLGGMYQFIFGNDEEDDGHHPPRRPRVVRPRVNFYLDPLSMRERFRLSPQHIDMLEHRIGHILQHETDQNDALTPREQIIVALRYLATGAYYRAVGDAQGVSKSTVSRCVHNFVDAIVAHVYPEVVKWPDDPDQLRGMTNEFLRRGMPSVFGCIDGSHIDIIAPSHDEPQFVNRHQRHSINAAFVCGPTMRFYYICSRWPGAVHDARVFRNCALKQRLDTGWRPIEGGVLLGDSAYGDCEYLVTPLAQCHTAQERAFNKAQRKTRNLIECAIGILKQRFRCLLDSLHFPDPAFSGKVIQCCGALHNLLMPEDEASEELDAFDRERFLADANIESEEEDDEDDHHDLTRRRQLIALF